MTKALRTALDKALTGYIKKFEKAHGVDFEWAVNGVMTKLPPDDWKTLLTAAFRQESQQMAAGLSGGFVFLGMRTSKMSKKEFSEFIEFIHATAALRRIEL